MEVNALGRWKSMHLADGIAVVFWLENSDFV